jgi:hypothetical protein
MLVILLLVRCFLSLGYLPSTRYKYVATRPGHDMCYLMLWNITKIWDALHLTWKERNNDLHRMKGAAPLQLKRIQLLDEITELYTSQPLMLSCDRDIFSIPLSARLTQSTNGLRHFLELAKPIVKRSKADATDVLLTGQHKIRSFLRRPPIPAHLIDILADLPNRDLTNREDPELPEDEGPPDPVLEEDSVSEDWDS